MPATVLQLVNRAERELGFTASATVIDNVDEQAVQFLNLANGLGNDLVREYDWQQLQTENSFSTVFFDYTATTTLGSTTISVLSSTTGLTTNPTRFAVSGAGIPSDTTLVSVDAGAATAVISREATATGTLVALDFDQIRYAMPSDFDRLIDNTDWDKTNNWPIVGPNTPQQWQWLKGGMISTAPRARFRVYGNLFVIWPPLGSENFMRFEYVSNFWVATASGGTPSKSSYTIDADASVFPDRVMVTGLKMRYAQANGMDWLAQSLSGEYARQLSISKANDAGSQTLNMGARQYERLLNQNNIQEGNFTL